LRVVLEQGVVWERGKVEEAMAVALASRVVKCSRETLPTGTSDATPKITVNYDSYGPAP